MPSAAPHIGGGQRFANLALHSTGHRSASALRIALRRGTATHPLGYPYPNRPDFMRLPNPTHGSGAVLRTGPAVPPDNNVLRWLESGAPRVCHRFYSEGTNRLYAPSFFDGQISLAQAAQLISNKQSDDQTALLALKREYTVTPDPFTYKRLDRDPFLAISSSFPPQATGVNLAPGVPPPSPHLAEVLARRPITLLHCQSRLHPAVALLRAPPLPPFPAIKVALRSLHLPAKAKARANPHIVMLPLNKKANKRVMPKAKLRAKTLPRGPKAP